jgi:hypothetical protein
MKIVYAVLLILISGVSAHALVIHKNEAGVDRQSGLGITTSFTPTLSAVDPELSSVGDGEALDFDAFEVDFDTVYRSDQSIAPVTYMLVDNSADASRPMVKAIEPAENIEKRSGIPLSFVFLIVLLGLVAAGFAARRRFVRAQ